MGSLTLSQELANTLISLDELPGIMESIRDKKKSDAILCDYESFYTITVKLLEEHSVLVEKFLDENEVTDEPIPSIFPYGLLWKAFVGEKDALYSVGQEDIPLIVPENLLKDSKIIVSYFDLVQPCQQHACKPENPFPCNIFRFAIDQQENLP